MATALAEIIAELAESIAVTAGKGEQASAVQSIISRLQTGVGAGLGLDRVFRIVLGHEIGQRTEDVQVDQATRDRINQLQRHIDSMSPEVRENAIHNAFVGGIGNIVPNIGLRQRAPPTQAAPASGEETKESSEGTYGRRPDILIDIPLDNPGVERMPRPIRRPRLPTIPELKYGAGAAGAIAATGSAITGSYGPGYTPPPEPATGTTDPTIDNPIVDRLPKPIRRPVESAPGSDALLDAHSFVFPHSDMLDNIPVQGKKGSFRIPTNRVYYGGMADPYMEYTIKNMLA